MKFTLQITDATKEEILAFLAGTTSIVNPLNGKITGAVIADGNVTGAAPSDDDNAPNLNAPGADTVGMPHDVRIHSDNKKQNADGTWRKRRGVDAAMVAAVEAELKSRAVQQLPPQYQQPPQQPAPMMPHVQQQPPQQYQPQYMPPPGNPNYPPQDQQPQYQLPPQPQYQQPPQQPAAVATDFGAFMQHLTGNFNKRDQNGQPLITADYLAGVAQRLSAQTGIPFTAITDLGSNPSAIPIAVQLITADGRWN